MRTPMLLVVAALALAPPAAAQPSSDPSKNGEGDNPSTEQVDEARKHFNEGVRLSASGKAGEVAQALDEFQKAYDLIPNWRILYNIGQTSRHVRDHARSLRAFTRYLAEGKDEIPKARRQEVEREIEALKPLVARLELAGSEDGAEVTVDGKPAGKMPLAEPLYVNAGKRAVRVSREGKRPFEKELELQGGKSERLEILLEPLAAGGGPSTKPTATATAKPPPPPPRGDYSTPATLAWIGAGVFAAGAAGIGTWALLESNDLEDTPYAGPDRRPAEGSDLGSQASRIDTLAIVTDVLVGAAVISAGLGVYFSFFAGGSSSSTGSGAAPARATAAPGGLQQVGVRVMPRGASLVGRF
jgi:hypothetical protein